MKNYLIALGIATYVTLGISSCSMAQKKEPASIEYKKEAIPKKYRPKPAPTRGEGSLEEVTDQELLAVKAHFQPQEEDDKFYNLKRSILNLNLE